MKTFNQLIRLHKHRLHERQKAMARLEADAADLKLRAETLEAEALVEEARAEETDFGLMSFAGYFAGVKLRRAGIASSRRALDVKIEGARTELRGAFRELKRIEILRDQKQREAAQSAQKAEQTELDEVAINQHRRDGSA